MAGDCRAVDPRHPSVHPRVHRPAPARHLSLHLCTALRGVACPTASRPPARRAQREGHPARQCRGECRRRSGRGGNRDCGLSRRQRDHGSGRVAGLALVSRGWPTLGGDRGSVSGRMSSARLGSRAVQCTAGRPFANQCATDRGAQTSEEVRDPAAGSRGWDHLRILRPQHHGARPFRRVSQLPAGAWCRALDRCRARLWVGSHHCMARATAGRGGQVAARGAGDAAYRGRPWFIAAGGYWPCFAGVRRLAYSGGAHRAGPSQPANCATSGIQRPSERAEPGATEGTCKGARCADASGLIQLLGSAGRQRRTSRQSRGGDLRAARHVYAASHRLRRRQDHAAAR